MIHLRGEGQCMKLGLNITITEDWASIGFTWCWLNVEKGMMSARRLRFRLKHSPHIIHSTHIWDYVDNFLWNKNKLSIPREWAEDYFPQKLLDKLFPDDPVQASTTPAQNNRDVTDAS